MLTLRRNKTRHIACWKSISIKTHVTIHAEVPKARSLYHESLTNASKQTTNVKRQQFNYWIHSCLKQRINTI